MKFHISVESPESNQIDPAPAGPYNLSVPAALSYCRRFAATEIDSIEVKDGRALYQGCVDRVDGGNGLDGTPCAPEAVRV
jgi:hypothetical protein